MSTTEWQMQFLAAIYPDDTNVLYNFIFTLVACRIFAYKNHRTQEKGRR